MAFSQLAAAELDPALLPEVESLLALKRRAPEVREIPRIRALDRYLEEGIARVKEILSGREREPAPDWAPLNDLFLSVLDGKP